MSYVKWRRLLIILFLLLLLIILYDLLEDNTQVMFGPLSFRNGNDSNWNGDDYETDCLLCDDRFNLDLSLHIFVKHIFEVHHLVIEDVQNIFNLPG